MNDYQPFELSIASCGLGHVTRGIETWAHDLTLALRAREIPVGCFHGAGQADSPLDRIVPCVTRSSRQSRWLRTLVPPRLGWRLGWGTPYTLEQTTFARKLIPYLRELNVKVLHVQDPLVALAVQRAHRKGRCPTRVILGHGTEEPIEFLQQLEYVQHLAPWHLEQATASLRSRGLERVQWTAIPNFVNTKLFCPGDHVAWRNELNIPLDATVILCAAAIKRHHKRIDYLIDEFAEVLKRPSARRTFLIVAGARERDTDELREWGKQRLGDRVRFLVNVDRSKMPSLFQTANLFTLCSLEEMMPIALLEAISSGLPCVIHDRPVMRWMAGPSAIVGDLEHPGGWANAVGATLADAPRLTQLSHAARQHCEENFSTTSVVDQLLAYYDSVQANRINCLKGAA